MQTGIAQKMLIFYKYNLAEEKLRNLHIDDPLKFSGKLSKCFGIKEEMATERSSEKLLE